MGAHVLRVTLLCLSVPLALRPQIARGPAVRPCIARNLNAATQLEGCAGSLCGWIIFTGRSTTACELAGYPAIHLSHRSTRLPVAVRPLSPPMVWQLFQQHPSRTVLHRGQKAFVLFQLSWCGPTLFSPLLLHIALPHRSGSLVIGSGARSARQVVRAPCSGGPHFHPHADVGPFLRYPLQVPPPRA